MASKSARSFLTNFALFLMFHIAIFVQGDECPQQVGGPSTTNERAAKLSGTGYVCQTYICSAQSNSLQNCIQNVHFEETV